MSAISFWSRPGRFPPRRAARFGAPTASSSTGRTNSFGWTPEPSRWGAPESPMLVGPGNGPCRRVEPFRIGMTVLMLNRPRPALQLFALLYGGFAMGTTAGLVVLFVFRRTLLGPAISLCPTVRF